VSGVGSAEGGFSSAAGTSTRLRPTFARAAIGRLKELVRLGADSQSSRVLSVESGSGILVGQLARSGLNCWALAYQQALAVELKRSLPQVRVTSASLIALPIRSAEIELLCIGGGFEQALTENALAETRRVLRYGATLVQVINQVDGSVPWVQNLAALTPGALSSSQWLEAPGVSAYFGEPTVESFPNSVPSSVDHELDRMRADLHAVAIASERQIGLQAAAKELLTAQADSSGLLERPQHTVLRYWRAV
jgi:hypothetical protein